MAKAKIDENLVAENIRQIIEQLAVSATIEVSKVDGIYFIDIESEDSALLIGKHGSNLDSLQFILSVRLKTQLESEEFEIFVDVNGWRKEKEDKLKRMADTIAQKVLASGKPQNIYNLRGGERRVIHMVLEDHPEVSTESEGEGINRYLVVKPAK